MAADSKAYRGGRMLSNLISTSVSITWKDDSWNWHNYKVLDVDSQAGWICLQGEAQGDTPFGGGWFWISLDEIGAIEER